MTSLNIKIHRKMQLLLPMIILAGCIDPGTRTSNAEGGAGTVESPIAFIKKPIPKTSEGVDHQIDLRDPLFFHAGGDVFTRSNSTTTSTEINVTSGITNGVGDVKDLKPASDGSKFLFTLRLNQASTWNIYEYTLLTKKLRCVIDSNPSTAICDGSSAEEGDDIGPAYLPDGRIIFSSNRQVRSLERLTNEGRPRFKVPGEDGEEAAMLLHTMNDSGSEIEQVSFNQSHDLDPTLLSSSDKFAGQVVFTRWDHAVEDKYMHLYKMNPDGGDLQHFYGIHSHFTGSNLAGTNSTRTQFGQVEEMENGLIMLLTRPYTGTYGGGDIVVIDTDNFVNNNQSVPGGPSGPAQKSATVNVVGSTAGELSRAGRYSAAFPLWDGTNRMLVSKSSCQTTAGVCINSDGGTEVSPVYSVWLYNMENDTEKLIIGAEANTVITDVISLPSRTVQSNIEITTEKNESWKAAGLGAIHIRSVYDFGGGSFNGCFLSDDCTGNGETSVDDLASAAADSRPARFVRFVKPVSLPANNDPDLGGATAYLTRDQFGPQREQGMREIIGYAPVAADGSVKVKVPANIPLAINVLDKNGRRIGARHQNWFQVTPGETAECTGCHQHGENNTTSNTSPYVHHRRDAERPSINAGTTLAEEKFANAEVQFSPDLVDGIISYQYASLSSATPETSGCSAANWSFKCRILINYKEHIHPIWNVDRGANTCTHCHSAKDIVGIDQVPAGQLDLSTAGDTIADDRPVNHEQMHSYKELFYSDAGQELFDEAVFDDETDTAAQVKMNLTNANYKTPIGVPDDADYFDGISRDVVVSYDVTYSIGNARTHPADEDLINSQVATDRVTPIITSEQVMDVDGNPIPVLALDIDGNIIPVLVQELDSNGNPVVDENGDPVYQQEVDSSGNPVVDINGDPVFQQEVDANGDPVYQQEVYADGYLVYEMHNTYNFRYRDDRNKRTRATMLGNSAREHYFLEKVESTGHAGFMTGHELRLVSEWLDIGAQYYNNPFDHD